MGFKDYIVTNCEQATALVEKKRDKKLNIWERLSLWIHVGYCSVCTLFFKQSEVLDQAAKHYSDRVDNEHTKYSMNPERKARINAEFEAEVNAPR